MRSDVITNCVVQHLRDHLNEDLINRVGDHDIPSDNPPMPHCIVYFSTSSGPRGGFDDPEEDRDFIFHIKGVARGREQAQWILDNVTEVMTKEPIDIAAISGGKYTGNVQWCHVDSLGSIVTTGDTLFQGTNSYRLRAGK